MSTSLHGGDTKPHNRCGSPFTVVVLALMAVWFSEAAGPCNGDSLYPLGRQTVVTVPRPEGDRYFIVYVPSTYVSSQQVALQLLFHGLNDNCYNFINETGFIPYSEAHGYVIAAPCGSIGLLGIGWNSGTCCGFETEAHPDDFAFSRQVVSTISANVCIDPEKVLTSGFSNGAMMSQVLGCESPDIFRGVASVSGIVELRPGNSEGLHICTSNISTVSSKRPSVLMVHGDADLLVPWTGDELLGFPPVPDNANHWVSRNNCSGPPVTTLFNLTHYTNQVWSNCTSGWEQNDAVGSVQLVRHFGGGHEWPEGNFDTTGYIHNWTVALFGSLTKPAPPQHESGM